MKDQFTMGEGKTMKTYIEVTLHDEIVSVSGFIADLLSEGSDLLQVKDALEDGDYLSHCGLTTQEVEALHYETTRLIQLYN